MSKTATVRELSLNILEKTFKNGAYADDLVEKTFRAHALDARDRALLTELVNGTLRWHGRLQWLLRSFLKKDLSASPLRLRLILELALYQLEFTDKIPGYAAVNESVELAKRSGGAGWARLVNGVLRNYLRRGKVDPASISDPVEALAVQESHPEWLVRRWVARYGLEDTRRLCQHNNRRPHVTLRVNRRKTTVAELRAALQEAGIETEPSTYFEDFLKVRNAQGLTDTRAFKDGWFAIQDESTALPVRLLAPEEGETVLDLCAAPGGKSAYLAELQGDRGRVLAVDLSARRLSRVQENVRRLGLRSVQPLVADGTQLQVRPVDKILLDAPCSGLGVLAKRADLRWKRRPEDLARAAERQRALLAHAAQLLRPGGVLVYSTCTIEPEENEQVVEEFLRTHPDFAVDAWAPEGVDSALRDGPYWRTLPHVHGTDGTFAVRLEKREHSEPKTRRNE